MTRPEPTIAEARATLRDALLSADRARLTEVVSDGCAIIGPKGYQIDRDEWIAAHVDDVYELVRLDTVDATTHAYADTVLVTEPQRSECVFRGQRIEGLYRVGGVWHRGTGRWRLVGLQYTAVADEAAPDSA